MSDPDPEPILHSCSGELPSEGADGAAVVECMGCEDGSLWVISSNGAMSQVGYCPYCGYEAALVPTTIMLKRLHGA